MSILAMIKASKAAGTVVSTVRKGSFLLRANSPAICMGAGLVSMAAGTGIGIWKAMDIRDTLEENIHYLEVLKKAEIGQTFETKEGKTVEVTKEFVNKNIKNNYILMGGKLIRTFAPVIALEVFGAALVLQSHHIMMTRAAAMAAAMASMKTQFDGFYDRVVGSVGEEEASRLRYGINKELVQETIIDAETGEEVTRTVEKDVFDLGKTSMYAVEFSPRTSKACRESNIANLTFLDAQLEYINRMYKKDGFVFLNDVKRALGLECTEEGQKVGWHKKSKYGDEKITFMLYDIPFNQTAIKGGEQRYILDFNVDGEIYQLLKKSK